MQELKFYVGGNWQNSETMTEDINPFSGEVFAMIPVGSQGQLDSALRKAYMAFSKTKVLSARARSRALLTAGNLLVSRRKDFLTMLVHESGRTFREAKEELATAAALFRSASETALTIKTSVSPSDVKVEGENSIAFVQRFSSGPVLGVSSFAEPLLDAVRKIAPAIAAGNPVLLCPPLENPGPALLLAEVLEQCEYPEEAISVIPCREEELHWLAGHDIIKVILYSGSSDTGWALKSKAVKKKMLMEMGGLGVALINRDAELEYAADMCVASAFQHAGQLASSLQRILVHEDVFYQFLGKFIKKSNQLIAGNPADIKTDVGPVVSEEAAQKIETWIKDAVGQGADLVTGGNRNGSVVSPTVFLETTGEMVISNKAVQGPVVSLQPFSDLESALWTIHDIDYGLQTALFTRDLALAMDAYRALDVGTVLINQLPSFRAETLIYGGMKNSGFGRSSVEEAVKIMTEERMLLIKHP